MDGKLSLAVVVGHADFAAQRLLEAFFHLHRQRTRQRRGHRLFCGLCQLFAQSFGLTDVQLVVRYHLSRFLLQLRRRQTQNDLCVSDRNEAAFQQFQHCFRQAQQPQAVGQCAPALAQLAGGLLLGQIAAGHQLTDAGRLFHGVKVFALQVLHQRKLHGLLIGHVLDNDRHLGEARHPAGPPAALACHDEIAAGRLRAHRDGLQ